jgi:hypothetical protein
VISGVLSVIRKLEHARFSDLATFPISRTFLVVSINGWMSQHQHQVIEYLIEENRVL